MKLQADRAIETTFKNGVVLTTTDIHPLRRYARLELQGFKDSVRTLTSRDLDRFCSEELPELSKIVAIHDPHGNLPTVVEEPPNLEIIAETDGDLLSLTSRMVYGQPPMAYIEHGRLIATSQSTGADGNHLQNQQMPRRLPEQERVLAHELSSFGVVAPGQTVHYQGCSALHQLRDLTSKIAQLPHRLKKTVQCHGAGWQSFASIGALTPELSGLNDEAALQFQLSPSTSTSQGASGAPSRNRSLESYTLDPETVYQAFIAGEHHVAIYEERGSKNLVGFAELPEDWLRRYGDILGDYLAAKRAGSKLGSAANLVGYEELFDGLGAEVPNLTTKLATIGEDFSGIPQTPTPAGLNAILRPYQSQGYQWLCFLRDHELGGILADDMGLGKTLQTIAVLKGHCLVIVPKSLLGNWQSECQRFRPGLKVSVYHGDQRTLEVKADVVLTTYGTVRQDSQSLAKQVWDAIILDEAQTIKNPLSKTTQAVFGLQGRFKLALTGTPVENRLEDLWSQMNFVNPGHLFERQTFLSGIGKDIENGDPIAVRRLRRLTAPFILRRLKRQVAKDLPSRTDMVLPIMLTSEERRTYEAMALAAKHQVQSNFGRSANAPAGHIDPDNPSATGSSATTIEALECLLRMRQACCDARLLPIPNGRKDPPAAEEGASEAKPSTKIAAVVSRLIDQPDRRTLVFSQWTSFLDLIEQALSAAALTHSRIDGSTVNRSQVVADFQTEGGPQVLLMTLKAGGVGLNLTAAEQVFIMDPWWNPATEEQAAARVDRIGQTKPVFIYRVIASNSVEEKILALQDRKRQLAASVLEGSGAKGAGQLTRQDLLDLLA